MVNRKFLPLALCLCILPVCRHGFDPVEIVTGAHGSNQVCLTNGKSVSIGFALVDQRSASLVDLFISCSESTSIRAKTSACWADSLVAGFDSASDTILAYWWTCGNNEAGGIVKIPVR